MSRSVLTLRGLPRSPLPFARRSRKRERGVVVATWLAWLIWLGLAGCAVPIQVNLGPTVDTSGNVGFEGGVTVGLATPRYQLAVDGRLDGGVTDGQVGSYVAGLAGVSLMPWLANDHRLRFGFLGGARYEFPVDGSGTRFWAHVGAEAAVLFAPRPCPYEEARPCFRLGPGFSMAALVLTQGNKTDQMLLEQARQAGVPSGVETRRGVFSFPLILHFLTKPFEPSSMANMIGFI